MDTVREDPVRKGLLFAGTETAVWMSLDAGDHWQSLQYNLPHTSMRDLWIKDNDLIVATHGRSFWILDDISALRQVDSVKGDAYLFKPGDAYRVRRSTYTDTPLPIDEPAGENPPDGAAIDYYLPDSSSGPVTLEILDASGKLVRKYASTDAPYATQEQLAKQLIPLYWIKMPQTLPAAAGMHRWIWDLRYATPTATSYEYPISAVPHRTPRTPQGPLALPGTYTVRLTANGNVLTETLIVKMDPRVEATPGDLTKLFAVENELASSVNSGAEAALEAHSIREQIGKLAKNNQPPVPAPVKEQLEKLDKQIASLLDGVEKSASVEEVAGLDGLSEETASLYGQVGQSDAAPTSAQEQAADHTVSELREALPTWERIKTSSIPEVNRALEAAHLPILKLDQQPETMPESGDED